MKSTRRKDDDGGAKKSKLQIARDSSRSLQIAVEHPSSGFPVPSSSAAAAMEDRRSESDPTGGATNGD